MARDFEDLKAAFFDRYEIVREVGHGGMATVYLAWDARHGRQVAIKVLDPDVALEEGGDRFVREIGIAARLSHPHILPLHDSGRADGLLYYVMPFVEGESLQDRLSRETQLPIDEAVQIAREVAAGLDHAHREGVVHRDIKPGNILLTPAGAVVSDFGIARALEGAGAERLTRTGVAIGTPAYMSPEQSGGPGAIDGRVDQYALACVLYEMLVGEPPFTGPNPQVITARHASAPVPPLNAARGTVPEGVIEAIATALAKVPADRFADMAAFARALERGSDTPPAGTVVETGGSRAPPRKRFAWLTASVALAGLAALLIAVLPSGRAGGARVLSVGVLPFANTNLGPEGEYLSDGIAEDLIQALRRLPNLDVAAQTSTWQFKGANLSAPQVADSIGVAAVLAGRVRRTTDGFRITCELVRGSNGEVIWSSQYDAEAGGLFDTHDAIVEAMAGALQVRVSADDLLSTRIRSSNPTAYDRFMRGRHHLALRGRPDLDLAIEHLQDAVRLDNTLAPAWSALGEAWVIASAFGTERTELPTSEIVKNAAEALKRALAEDPRLAHAYAVRGLLSHVTGRLDEAEADLRQALALDPANGDASRWLAQLNATRGRGDSATAVLRRAERQEPFARATAFVGQQVYFWLGDYDRVIERANRVAELGMPGSASTRIVMASIGLGRVDEAESIARSLISNEGPDAHGRLAAQFAAIRAFRSTGTTPSTAPENAAFGPSWPLMEEFFRLSVGDVPAAFAVANRAIDADRVSLAVLLDAHWGLVADDPRYAELVGRVRENYGRYLDE
ncbi:MAG: protein kinase [Gemmatimonadota bacterium]|nr:protein kinase [Gemmatimonadota bacterium]